MGTVNRPGDNDKSNEATTAVNEAESHRFAPGQVEAITEIVVNVVKNLQEGETQKGPGKRLLRALGWIVASWAFFAFLLSAVFVGIGLYLNEISPWRVVEESVTPYSAAQAREKMVRRHIELGNSFLNIGQPKAAQAEFEDVLRIDPNNEDAELGILKSDLYIPILEEDYNLEVQEQRVQLLLEENKNDSHGQAFLGTMLTEVAPGRALKHYEKAVRANPSNAEAYYGMGNIYQAQGDFDQALEMFQRAQKKAHWNPKYIHALAYMSYRNKQYDKAYAQLSTLSERDPQYLWSYPDVALTGQLLGYFEIANSFQRKLISLLEHERIVSMEKNQGTLARHTKEGPVSLSQPSEKLYYAYYNAALTFYLLDNKKDAKQYIQAAQDQQLGPDVKEAVEQIVDENITTLVNRQPDLKTKAVEFTDKFIDSGEAAPPVKDAKLAQDSSTSNGEGEAVGNAVRNHYEAIGEQNFEEAYSYFGSTQQDLIGQGSWISAEKSYGIEDSTVHSLSVTEVGENTATAVIDVSFKDKTGNPRFLITWKLTREDERWKLDQQLSANRLE